MERQELNVETKTYLKKYIWNLELRVNFLQAKYNFVFTKWYVLAVITTELNKYNDNKKKYWFYCYDKTFD